MPMAGDAIAAQALSIKLLSPICCMTIYMVRSMTRTRAAAKFVDQHALGLRAGDALHLAATSEHGATAHTLDPRLADAGPVLGV